MKKFISLLLVLCMALSVLSIGAFAAEITNEEVADTIENGTENRFYSDVKYVYGKAYFDVSDHNGASAQEYLEGTVTRGYWAIVLCRMNGVNLDEITVPEGYYETSLTDMAAYAENVELYKSVYWAASQKNAVVNGYKDGTFRPEKEITREEMCAMLYRAIKGGYVSVEEVETNNFMSFTDLDSISDYAYDAIKYCVENGIIQGYSDGTFGAGERGTTLFQLAAMISRAETVENRVDTTKFYLGVESGEGFVDVAVDNNYAFRIRVTNAKVDASEVTVTAKMNSVGSLGVDSEREHSVTVNTSLTQTPELKTWLSNVFEFEGAAVNVSINGTECAYVLTGEYTDGEIAYVYGIPVDAEATRTAWHTLVNDETIKTYTDSADDSYIVIGGGSELVVGGEVLGFEDGVNELVLDNFSNLGALKDTIKAAVKVEDKDADVVAEGTLTAGTTLAVGSSRAELLKDVTVSVDTDADVDLSMLEGCLSSLRDAANQDTGATYGVLSNLMHLLNNLVAAVDEAETVDVTVTIGE